MSTSVFEVFGRLSHVGTFVLQHNAWFDSGFLLIRQTTQALTGTGRFPWSFCSADHGDSTIAALERGDRCPCCFGHAGSLPRRGAEAVSHGQACLADHRDFAVAARAGFFGSSKSRVHRYTARVTPAIRAGTGCRELAPRCSATQLGACFVGAYGETHVVHKVQTTTTTPLLFPPPRV